MKQRFVYGIEYVYMDEDNYPSSRLIDEDIYEDRDVADAVVLEMNKGVVRPTGRWDADYYAVATCTFIPKTFKEHP